jgi:hypothetical protein
MTQQAVTLMYPFFDDQAKLCCFLGCAGDQHSPVLFAVAAQACAVCTLHLQPLGHWK